MILQEKSLSMPYDEQQTLRKSHLLTEVLHEGVRQVTLFPLLRLYIHPTVAGSEHIPKNGPALFVANHSSHLDAPLVLAALPLRIRLQVRVAAAADYFFTRPWLAASVSLLLNAFPITRKGAGCAASLASSIHLLRQGYSVLLFPEGTRSKDGHLQPFKQGAARLALAEHVPVVPIWIDGAHAAWPKGARWPRPHRVVLRFGPPMRFAGSEPLPTVIAEIERQVRVLAPQTQEG